MIDEYQVMKDSSSSVVMTWPWGSQFTVKNISQERLTVEQKYRCKHSHKKQKDSLETQTKPPILRTYVENQPILELNLLYHASKCKQTQKQSRRTVFMDLFYGPRFLPSCEIIISVFFLFSIRMWICQDQTVP